VLGEERGMRRSRCGVSVLETDRLNRDSDWVNLGSLQREATPQSDRKVGIRLHVAELSLTDPASMLADLGLQRHRTTHTHVRKADLRPAKGFYPGHVTVDEAVIRLDNQ
jgi:hypothetical protein